MIAVFDIDGTLRRVADPWLHLHRHLGTINLGEGFYRRFISGEISYAEMATLDVSTWKGISRKRMLQCLDTNPIRDGAYRLVQWFRVRHIPCVGISTGLSIFNDITKTMLGLDEVICNAPVFSEDICTGTVIINVEEQGKANVLRQILQRYEIKDNEIFVFGDSRADIPMFELASVSVAVFPRSEDVAGKANLIVDIEPIDCICDKLDSILGIKHRHNNCAIKDDKP